MKYVQHSEIILLLWEHFSIKKRIKPRNQERKETYPHDMHVGHVESNVFDQSIARVYYCAIITADCDKHFGSAFLQEAEK